MSKTIALDLRSLQIGHENRGIGMVIKSILENINDYENDYIFYCFDKNNPLDELSIVPSVSKYTIVYTESRSTSVKKASNILDSYRLLFHNFKALKKMHINVFIQFDASLGVPKWRKLNTFTYAYDLIPIIMKSEYLPSPISAMRQKIGKRSKIKAAVRALYYQFKYRVIYSNLKKSSKILSISETTKDSLVKLLGIKSDRISVLPLAPVAPKELRSSKIINTINKPYIFYIGGTDSRKRIEDIVYSFNICRGRGEDIALVLAGNEFRNIDMLPNIEARNAITASPYKDDIYLVGFVSDDEKASLYTHARAFVFASMYEGFGLPVVEAASCKCPVVAYDNSSIKEIMGKSAMLVETGSYESLAKSIGSLSNNETRDKYIKMGYSVAKNYTWNSHINKLKKLINN